MNRPGLILFFSHPPVGCDPRKKKQNTLSLLFKYPLPTQPLNRTWFFGASSTCRTIERSIVVNVNTMKALPFLALIAFAAITALPRPSHAYPTLWSAEAKTCDEHPSKQEGEHAAPVADR